MPRPRCTCSIGNEYHRKVRRTFVKHCPVHGPKTKKFAESIKTKQLRTNQNE